MTARMRRCADADEVHVAECRGTRVGRGERQTPGIQPGSQKLPEPRLVDGQLPGVQLVYLRGIDVNAENIESEARHAGGMCDAQVAGAQYDEPW